jgi:hypothetical protein
MNVQINTLIKEELLISPQFCAPHSRQNNITTIRETQGYVILGNQIKLQHFLACQSFHVMLVTSNLSLEST